MLIGLDLDGVEADWDGYLDRQLDLNPNLAGFPRQPERGWNNFAEADARHKKAVYQILEHPSFYAELEPIPGAVEAAQLMRADGHDVIFVSSPWETNPMGYQAKADWLAKHYGSWARKNLILTSDKTIIYCDVLVDDKPEIKGRLLRPDAPQMPSWTRVFYHQSYNAGLEGARIMNWTDGSWEGVLYSVGSSATL